MMFRRAVFDFAGGYRKKCEYWDDQDLIARMAAVSKVLVIPQALYQLRQWTRNTRGDRLDPRVFVSLGSMALRAGGSRAPWDGC